MLQPTLRRAAALALCLAGALGLSACVDETADLAQPDPHVQIARRPDMNIAAASVAFVSVDGPPAAIGAGFDAEVMRQAAADQIVIADAKKARYLVRGYLSAYRIKDGAAVEYVWDVFTRDKQRTQRVSDVVEVKGEGDDPWAIVGQAALTSVAAKSADDLTAYLTNTPEAVAMAHPAAEAAADKPLSYAPTE